MGSSTSLVNDQMTRYNNEKWKPHLTYFLTKNLQSTQESKNFWYFVFSKNNHLRIAKGTEVEFLGELGRFISSQHDLNKAGPNLLLVMSTLCHCIPPPSENTCIEKVK